MLLIADVVVIQISAFFGLYVRFDFKFSTIPPHYLNSILDYAIINTILTIIVFTFMKLYKSVWRFASSKEFVRIILASLIAGVVQVVVLNLFNIDLPRSFSPIFGAALTVGVTCIRFSYRIMRGIRNIKSNKSDDKLIKTMIVGAGSAGEVILKELETNKFINKKVSCLVDDNKLIQGKYIRGVQIEGDRNDIIRLAAKHDIDEIFITIPSADENEIKDILNICKNTDCSLKILPGLYQLINGEVNTSKLRQVEIEDLLGRTPVKTKIESIMQYVSDRTVLVTGGGGSIGSELCRQIAIHNPRTLIIVDIYENNAYDIQNELKRKHPKLNLIVLIASVRDEKKVRDIFEKYRPDVVYHAAAHKHVPLMEDSPNEAIKNNVFGTYNVANASDIFGAQKFILISTDKAVNPTNIMGASKRICEMIIHMFSSKSKTEYVAVRFGNVLGSNGSVIPLFKKQISEGGPVTITHPDIIRYFMTIQEAVSLVLQAGSYAKGGEIFVLDMGNPVKIVELAKNLIRLSGYSDDEIKIVFTGLRPGEKLYEEMLMEEEGLKETDNKLIFIGKQIKFKEEEFRIQLNNLKEAAEKEEDNIRHIVRNIVSTYNFKSSDEYPIAK